LAGQGTTELKYIGLVFLLNIVEIPQNQLIYQWSVSLVQNVSFPIRALTSSQRWTTRILSTLLLEI